MYFHTLLEGGKMWAPRGPRVSPVLSEDKLSFQLRFTTDLHQFVPLLTGLPAVEIYTGYRYGTCTEIV